MLSGRIFALARVHSVLAVSEWKGAPLHSIVQNEMEAYTGRVSFDGPSILLKAGATQPMAIILHELSTNAAKYGALSRATGHLRVQWRVGLAVVRLRRLCTTAKIFFAR